MCESDISKARVGVGQDEANDDPADLACCENVLAFGLQKKNWHRKKHLQDTTMGLTNFDLGVVVLCSARTLSNYDLLCCDNSKSELSCFPSLRVGLRFCAIAQSVLSVNSVASISRRWPENVRWGFRYIPSW